MQHDKRAVKILFDTYWSPVGWKQHGSGPVTPPNDLAYAMQAGLMFPPATLNHDAVVERVLSLRSEIAPAQVGLAFVAGLSMKQPAILSALGSFGVALNMPAHRFSPASGDHRCSICSAYENKGEYDLNILNFERHKWGGVRHANPYYIALDLERFKAEGNDPPNAVETEKLHYLLAAVENLPAGAKLADLVRAIKPILPGNDAQRRTAIEILGNAGVLSIPDRIGFFHSFPITRDREHTPWSKDDWGYPTRWWRGGNGVDKEAVQCWFG